MTSIYWDPDRTRLAKFSASVASGSAGKQVVRIELESTDPFELAALIDTLRRIEAEQKPLRRRARSDG